MCETHENFNSKIANRYGTEWLTKVKEFARLRLKRTKLECSLVFLVKCRDSGVIPKFLIIKPVKCIREYDQFFRVASGKLLRKVIAENRRHLMCVNKKMYDLHLQLSQTLQQDLWEVLDAMSYSRSNITGLNINERHNKKLSYLKRQQRGDGSCAYPRNINKNDDGSYAKNETVVNLSSCRLDDNARNVLSRGLNYAPAPKKIPVENIISILRY